MSELPGYLTRERAVDLAGRDWQPWVRRALLLLVVGILAAGLANVFGQRPGTVASAGDRATLAVSSPDSVRGGLYYESRFTIRARRELRDAHLVLSSGWLEGMTVNTIEPAPLGEASRNGELALQLGHIPAGQKYVLYVQTQVNPTNVGHRDQDVELFDGPDRLLRVHREITIYP